MDTKVEVDSEVEVDIKVEVDLIQDFKVMVVIKEEEVDRSATMSMLITLVQELVELHREKEDSHKEVEVDFIKVVSQVEEDLVEVIEVDSIRRIWDQFQESQFQLQLKSLLKMCVSFL